MLEARARTHSPPFHPRRHRRAAAAGGGKAAKLMLNGKRVVSPTKESSSHLSIHFLSSSISFLPYTNAISRRRTLRKGREEGRLLSRMVRQLVFQVGRSSRSLQPGQCLHASLGFVKIPAKTGQLTRDMQAAVAYKIDNKWQESGQAYERCVFGIPFICLCIHNMCKCLTDHREAACRLRLNENNDAMNAFHNAAKSYKKSNPEGVCRPICHLIRVEELQLKRTDRF